MKSPTADQSKIQVITQLLLSGALAQEQFENYLIQEFGDVFIFLWQLYLAEELSGREGHFITEDPARDGNNWYLYVYNNPLIHIDPSGLQPPSSGVPIFYYNHNATIFTPQEYPGRKPDSAGYQHTRPDDYVTVDAYNREEKREESIRVPANNSFIDPVEGHAIGDSFGPREQISGETEDGTVLKTSTFHPGTDTPAPEGTPQRAMADGTVVTKGVSERVGNYIFLDHEGGFRTGHYHLKEPSDLAVGAEVDQGDTVGETGNTGISTGPHAHTELRWLGDKYQLDMEDFVEDE